MTKKLLPCGALVSLLAVFALAASPTTEDRTRKAKDWTATDLLRNPMFGNTLPISYEVILQNSIEALKKTSDDKELKQHTLELALALAQPQPPSPRAWQFMIDQGVLKDGISLEDAHRLLGRPTSRQDGEVRWYFNFRGMHVFPGLRATEDNGKLKDWEVYSG